MFDIAKNAFYLGRFAVQVAYHYGSLKLRN